MKKIVLFGATGSVGTNAIKALMELKNKYEIVCVSLDIENSKNIALLDTIKPKYALYLNNASKSDVDYLKNKYNDIIFLDFNNNYENILRKYKRNYFFNAISSIYGIEPLFCAIKNKYKKIFLANKESLVMAGDLIMDFARKNKVCIIPIDSEHYALRFLLLNNSKNIKKVIITASGGALRDYPIDKISSVKVNDVLKHPTWKMGKEITINSATMVNKVFEVVEAHHLFNIEYDKIEVLINKQSNAHAGVVYKDNRILLNVSKNDMFEPILLALSEPYSYNFETSEIDLTSLTFDKLDYNRYPLFSIGLDAIRKGKLYNTLFTASNQAAVNLFINGKIKYNEIVKIILEVLNNSEEYLLNYKYSIVDIIRLSKFLYNEITSKYKE